MRLLLVRHGETIWNVQGRIQGSADVPLSDQGRAQAVRLAAVLQHEPITAIYASDQQRAHATAAILAETHNLTVQVDARLCEQSKGDWEGLTWDDIEAQHPDAMAQWWADRRLPPPGGESVAAVADRVGAALESIRAAYADAESEKGAVLVVSHGMSLRTLICVALGIDPMIGWQFELGNTALSELRFTPDGAKLVRLNDTSHLRTQRTRVGAY